MDPITAAAVTILSTLQATSLDYSSLADDNSRLKIEILYKHQINSGQEQTLLQFLESNVRTGLIEVDSSGTVKVNLSDYETIKLSEKFSKASSASSTICERTTD